MYPPDSKRAVKQLFVRHSDDPLEQAAIEEVIELAHPSPSLNDLETASTLLVALGYISDETNASIDSYLTRNASEESLTASYDEKVFPTYHFIRRLFAGLDRHVDSTQPALELIWWLLSALPEISKFSGRELYEHHLALRKLYKRYFRSNDFSPNNLLPNFKTYLLKLNSASLNTAHTLNQIKDCLKLLDGDLRLGERQWHGGHEGGSKPNMEFALDSGPSDEMSPAPYIQSTAVSEAFLEDHEDDTNNTLTLTLNLPQGSTAKDKRSVVKQSVNGFERRNVTNKSDMRACSEITYTDYISFAYDTASAPAFALTWLAAFAGFDTSRPIRIGTGVPKHEEALLDAQKSRLGYNVIRRVRKEDNTRYETAGTMYLGLPSEIRDGLNLLCDAESPDAIEDECEKVSRKFAESNPGLRPTLPRLRNSAVMHVALKEMSHLEAGALGGRIAPSLKGASAYYSIQSRDLNSKFRAAYEGAIEKLGIACPRFLKKSIVLPNHRIFVRRNFKLHAVEELLTAIADGYATESEALKRRGPLTKMEEVVAAVQLHEVARYVLQQTYMGLRPIGDVAALQISRSGHALVCDKASRLFSERSYTPICDKHLQFISISEQNREILKRFALYSGIEVVEEEAKSDLASVFRYVEGDAAVLSQRLTNDFFRHQAPVAASHVDPQIQPNWMRKVAANAHWRRAPQWMLDELLGHRRCGREPFGHWSTADARNFQNLREFIDTLVEKTLDHRLLQPISVNC